MVRCSLSFLLHRKKRLEHVAEQAGIELDIHWHSFELDPDAPTKHEVSNTERLAQKYGRSYAEMEEMERNVAAMAATEGIDFQWQKPTLGIVLTLIASFIWHKAKV